MNNNITITKATNEDAFAISELMEYARIENEKKGFFCADDIDYISEHISNIEKGFILKAEKDGKLAGFFMLHFPHLDDNNMAHYKDLPQNEYDLVVHFDSAVVSPDCRGQKIMDRFLTKAEELLSPLPYIHYFATVHPDNHNSLQNLLNHHFEVVTTTQKYGGLTRHVMYKHKDM